MQERGATVDLRREARRRRVGARARRAGANPHQTRGRRPRGAVCVGATPVAPPHPLNANSPAARLNARGAATERGAPKRSLLELADGGGRRPLLPLAVPTRRPADDAQPPDDERPLLLAPRCTLAVARVGRAAWSGGRAGGRAVAVGRHAVGMRSPSGRAGGRPGGRSVTCPGGRPTGRALPAAYDTLLTCWSWLAAFSLQLATCNWPPTPGRQLLNANYCPPTTGLLLLATTDMLLAT